MEHDASSGLDLSADVVALTAALIDVPSESHHEQHIADLVEAALNRVPHLTVSRFGNTVVARTELGRSERVLIGGHLDVAGSNVAVARPHVRSGVLRVLSAHEVTGQPGLRNPFFPDVPTSREEGFDIDLIASTGMALPRGTAEPIVLAWSAAIRRALETDGVRSALHSAGVATQWLSPQDYAAHWRDAERKVKAFLEDSGVAVREG